jgi:hypothetical protein
MVAGWLSPVLGGLTVVLLGRAHFILYVRKRGSRSTAIITWLATTLVIGFWTWRLIA